MALSLFLAIDGWESVITARDLVKFNPSPLKSSHECKMEWTDRTNGSTDLTRKDGANSRRNPSGSLMGVIGTGRFCIPFGNHLSGVGLSTPCDKSQTLHLRI